jgi:SAM-dependent methyltransferase
MVDWAAERVHGPTWLPADAQRLAFPDDTFDVVVCQFGVMFFPDKPAAFAEMARVLKPGGTVIFTAWDVVEASELVAALLETLRSVLPDDAPDFFVRVPYGYHDANQIEQDVRAGGLRLAGIDRVVLRGQAASANAIAEGFGRGTPLRFALEERGDLDRLVAELAEKATERLGTGPLEGELAAFVVTAELAVR